MIAHRGASGYRPEHTLESYRLAIRQGADFIEPDLVPTADGVLVARHDNEISTTTDVAAHPEFVGRHTTKYVDGALVTGWFSEDFTLAEIKTLRARERVPALRPDNVRFDGMYGIPTLAEVLQLAERESGAGRRIGVYPEIKHPTYFAREGLRLDGRPIAIALGTALVATLVAEGFTDPGRVFIQSFEVDSLIQLRTKIMPAAGVDVPLVQLLGTLATDAPYDVGFNARAGADLVAIYGGLATCLPGGLGRQTRYAALADPSVLEWISATYAAGIGPSKNDLLVGCSSTSGADPEGGQGRGSPMRDPVPPLLADALLAGLLVHPYTLRAEPSFGSKAANGDRLTAMEEALVLLSWGAHGFFIDHPDVGVAARGVYLGAKDTVE